MGGASFIDGYIMNEISLMFKLLTLSIEQFFYFLSIL
jgi:hypothetical protein